MQDQDMPDPAGMLDQAQWLVLGALCGSGGGVCSTRELALAVGDGELAELAVAGLHAVGLVRRVPAGFVCATPAALRARELEACALRLVAGELTRSAACAPRRQAAPVRRQQRRMICRRAWKDSRR